MQIAALSSLLLVMCAQATPPVTVTVRESVAPAAATYTYRVVNRTGQPITALRVGYDSIRQEPQLRTLPPKWTFEQGLAQDTASAPPGWKVRLVTTEENPRFMIEWTAEGGGEAAIASGAAEERFRVVLASPAPEYRDAMFEVVLRDSTRLRGQIRLAP